MALDNWGAVERWVVKDKVTTLGPSGIGFVNFGKIGDLIAEAPIETFRPGARGFNVYTGPNVSPYFQDGASSAR